MIFALVLVLNATAQNSQMTSTLKDPCVLEVKNLTPKRVKKSQTPTEGIDLRSVEYIAKRFDSDCDGISNHYDKCQFVPSTNNRDSDGDGWGDPCDNISSDVSIKIATTKKRVRVGSHVRLIITVTNHGPKEKAGILDIIINQFPTSLNVSSVKTDIGECEEMDGEVQCNVEELAVGSNATIIIEAKAIRARRVAQIATVENGIGDLQRQNNKARISLTITR